MNNFFRVFFIACIFSFVIPVSAVQIEFHSFKNVQEEKLYLDLVAELRCVKCQNQNLAESNAELARDMRDKTYEMVVAGKTRDDVVSYMTARYGDFVLYNPPFKAKTLLLWVGPPILLLLSLFFILKMIRKQNQNPSEQLNDTDLDSVRTMLKSHSSSEK